MATSKEYVQLIDRLTELTQSEEIKWERKFVPESLESTENSIDYVYVTNYKDRYLRIYEEKYKNYVDEFDFHWADRVILEFIDEFGGHVWQFPHMRSIWDLLNAIKYNNAGVNDFIKNILNEL